MICGLNSSSNGTIVLKFRRTEVSNFELCVGKLVRATVALVRPYQQGNISGLCTSFALYLQHKYSSSITTVFEAMRDPLITYTNKNYPTEEPSHTVPCSKMTIQYLTFSNSGKLQFGIYIQTPICILGKVTQMQHITSFRHFTAFSTSFLSDRSLHGVTLKWGIMKVNAKRNLTV